MLVLLAERPQSASREFHTGVVVCPAGCEERPAGRFFEEARFFLA